MSLFLFLVIIFDKSEKPLSTTAVDDGINKAREEDVAAMVVEEVDKIVAVVGEDKADDELLAEDNADKNMKL